MKVKATPLGWKFYIIALAALVVAVLSIDPSLEKNPLSQIRHSFSNYAVVQLGLSGLKPESYSSLLSSIVKHTSKGEWPSTRQTIKIHIAFRHIQKMEAEREKALRTGILVDPQNYPARLEINGQRYSARIRLKGDLEDHWTGPSRWSFRIRLKDGRAAMGMNSFSIHKPPSRQIPSDNLFQSWLRTAGNITPRHDYANIYFNGDDWGVMNIEEHMAKEILEYNEHREAPILKIGSEDNWHFTRINENVQTSGTLYGRFGHHLYNARRYSDDQQHLRLFSFAGQTFNAFLSGDRQVEDVFDMEHLSRAVIASFIWQNLHAINLNNMRLHINPFSLKLVPITTDQGALRSFPQDQDMMRSGFSPFIPALLRSDAFYANLDQNIEQLKAAIPEIRKEHTKICNVFAFDCPPFDFSVFEKNFEIIEKKGAEYFRSLLPYFPMPVRANSSARNYPASPPEVGVQHVRHVEAKYFVTGELALQNILPHDVILDSAILRCDNSLECDSFNLIKAPVIIPSGFDGALPRETIIRLPENLELNRELMLDVATSLGDQQLVEQVSIALPRTVAPKDITNVTTLSENPLPDFINVVGKDLRVQAGDWTVTEPILVPKGYHLHFASGTTLRFSSTSYIFSESPIIAIGDTTSPIILTALDEEEKWGGVMVLKAEGPSELSHVTFMHTRAFEDRVRSTTGAISFYDSDVKMRYVTFGQNIAEDALNTVRSRFDMQYITFQDAASDAFDSDFSTGRIADASFRGIAGDGLDTSGSKISGSALTFHEIGDKAISIGEASDVDLNNIDIRDANIGVAVKDGSHVEINDASIAHFGRYGAMAYIKKEAYGPARIVINRSNLANQDVLNQTGSEMTLNGQPVSGQLLDVDALY